MGQVLETLVESHQQEASADREYPPLQVTYEPTRELRRALAMDVVSSVNEWTSPDGDSSVPTYRPIQLINQTGIAASRQQVQSTFSLPFGHSLGLRSNLTGYAGDGRPRKRCAAGKQWKQWSSTTTWTQ